MLWMFGERVWPALGLLVLALALGGAGAAEAASAHARARRQGDFTPDIWSNLVAGGAGAGAGGGFGIPRVIPIQVPLQGDNGKSTSVSLLLVPYPVPVAAPRADTSQCQPSEPQTSAVTRAPARPPGTPNVFANYDVPHPDNTNTAVNSQVLVNHQVPLNQPSIQVPLNQPSIQIPEYNPTEPSSTSPSAVRRRPRPQVTRVRVAPEPNIEPPAPAPPRASAGTRPARNTPYFPPVEYPNLLVEQFRAEVAPDPHLPAVVIEPVGTVSFNDYTEEELAGSSSGSVASSAPPERRRQQCRERAPAPGDADAGAPPPPRFEHSLFVRARLTVPRAGYTEKYSVRWDAASGASRIDFNDGTTSTYRMMNRDGSVQSVQIRVDRTGESDVRRCSVSAPRRVTLAERALPVLPDLQGFSFAGYVRRGEQRAELWSHTLAGRAGQLGGARGEALTFRHELLLARSRDNFTSTPLWYSVRVDSSVLGADCDGYVHYFDEVQPQHHDSAMFRLEIGDACEEVKLDSPMDNVEPLREFIMLRRHPRYDAEIEQYKQTYGRRYADDVEQAVRKNVLMQSSRFVSSGNRLGASFEMELGFLADRLLVERRVMYGVDAAAQADLGELFPHSKAELEALRGRLPRSFDWRKEGGVTPVRNQSLCMSCWAFATVGAVEGALFRETGRLVELSEQAVVDCAHPYGGHGCQPSWPAASYKYIKNIGAHARDEYTPYQGEALQCRAASAQPVTRISGFYNVTNNNILALKLAIKQYGPTVVIIDATRGSFHNHKKGFYHDKRCRLDLPEHALLAVGWTVHRGDTYFILKNSWSVGWGEGGYVRMRAPTNTCGLLRRPSVPRLRAADVLRVPTRAPVGATPPPPSRA